MKKEVEDKSEEMER